jgi:hypothetical protein
MNNNHSLYDWLNDEVVRLRLLVVALETENALLRQQQRPFDINADRPALLRPQI